MFFARHQRQTEINTKRLPARERRSLQESLGDAYARCICGTRLKRNTRGITAASVFVVVLSQVLGRFIFLRVRRLFPCSATCSAPSREKFGRVGWGVRRRGEKGAGGRGGGGMIGTVRSRPEHREQGSWKSAFPDGMNVNSPTFVCFVFFFFFSSSSFFCFFFS